MSNRDLFRIKELRGGAFGVGDPIGEEKPLITGGSTRLLLDTPNTAGYDTAQFHRVDRHGRQLVAPYDMGAMVYGRATASGASIDAEVLAGAVGTRLCVTRCALYITAAMSVQVDVYFDTTGGAPTTQQRVFSGLLSAHHECVLPAGGQMAPTDAHTLRVYAGSNVNLVVIGMGYYFKMS